MSEPKRLTMDEFNKLVNQTVDDRIKAMGLDRIDLKHGIVPSKDEVGKLPKQDRAMGLIRALFDKDYTRAAALSGGVGPEGGYLIPEEFRADVIRDLIAVPVMRARSTVFPVTSMAGSVPRLAGAIKTYWEGENQAITETTVGAGSDIELGQILWRVWRLDGMLRSSRELFADSGVNIYAVLVTMFAEAFRAAEDKAFMAGTGTGQPLGLRNTPGVTGIAQAGANLAYNDVVNLVYGLPQQYRAGSTFLLNNDVIKLLRRLQDTTNRPIWTDPAQPAPGLGSVQYATLLGYPVLEQVDIPSNLGAGMNESEIWFGNLRWYYIFDRETMAVETTTEGAGAFEKHQQIIKVFERLDGELSLAASVRKLTAVK